MIQTYHVPSPWMSTARFSDVPAYSQVLQPPFSGLFNGYSYRRRLPGLDFTASLKELTDPLDLPAPGRRQSVYVVLRLSTLLCF